MQLRIASPCPMSWDLMPGDNRVRFCGRCKLNVYNLAEMGEEEVARIVRTTEGRLCGRLYARGDGTALARDCPVGRTRKLLRRATAVAAVLLAGAAGWLFFQQADASTVSTPDWLRPLIDWIHPPAPPPPPLGEICPVPPVRGS